MVLITLKLIALTLRRLRHAVSASSGDGVSKANVRETDGHGMHWWSHHCHEERTESSLMNALGEEPYVSDRNTIHPRIQHGSNTLSKEIFTRREIHVFVSGISYLSLIGVMLESFPLEFLILGTTELAKDSWACQSVCTGRRAAKCHLRVFATLQRACSLKVPL